MACILCWEDSALVKNLLEHNLKKGHILMLFFKLLSNTLV